MNEQSDASDLLAMLADKCREIEEANPTFDRDQVLVICALMGYRMGANMLADTFHANLALMPRPIRPAI